VVDKTPSLFKCFACGEQGKLADLVDSYAELTDNDELRKLSMDLLIDDKPSLLSTLAGVRESLDDWVYDVAVDKPIVLNPDMMSYERFPLATGHLASSTYLFDERNMEPENVLRFDLRYDPRQNRVVFPVFDGGGNLYGAVGRGLTRDVTPKYYNYFGFAAGKSLGGLNHCQGHPKVLVSEGYFDISKTVSWGWDLGFDSVCTWHADLSEYQADQLASLDATIVFCYDNDSAGNTGWERAKTRLGGVCTLRRLTPPISVDLGDMNRPQFESFVKPFC